MLRFLNFPMILLLWAAYLTCYPTWVGHLYHADVMDPASQLQSGTFGLKEETESNPFWHPPVAYSDEMGATLRLPWQPVTRSAHIEIDTNQWWLHFTLGTMSLGLFIGTWALIGCALYGSLILFSGEFLIGTADGLCVGAAECDESEENGQQK